MNSPSPIPTQLVYITGASSGIGQALAKIFYNAGYRLALVARRTATVQQWAQQQELDTDRYAIYQADVADTASIVAAGQACLEQQGVPAIVIACAGISHGVNTAVLDDIHVMQRIIHTNVIGTAATFQPFIEPMRQRRKGTLVGISSVASIRGLPGHGAYCASKAAVTTYCESLRGELRDAGVRVVTLLPGYVDTPMTMHDTHSRPFLLSAPEFARRAYNAIVRSRTSHRVIPWEMGIVAAVLRLLPNCIFDRILSGRPRKPRLQHLPAPAPVTTPASDTATSTPASQAAAAAQDSALPATPSSTKE